MPFSFRRVLLDTVVRLEKSMTEFTHDDYEEFLNDIHPEVVVLGSKVGYGSIARSVEPIGFVESFNQYVNSFDQYPSQTNAY
jgi:uncharacterized protein (DUF488 family)